MSLFDLSLSLSVSQHVERLSAGLENGYAPILERVSPITAELLRFWFGQEYQDNREWNFHDGQKEAILSAIYAHEVLGSTSLGDLYAQVCPTAMLASADGFAETLRAKHPKYCLKMATGTGKTWVLQALLIWQLLNAYHDPESKKFTTNFFLIAPGLIVYERLIDAFLGKGKDGARDFSRSDLHRFRDLFAPEGHRETVFRFWQNNVCVKEEIGRKITANGLIAIINKNALEVEERDIAFDEDVIVPGAIDPKKVLADLLPLSTGGNDLADLDRHFDKRGVLRYCASLPNLLVFNDEAHHIHEIRRDGEIQEVEWQKSLNYISSGKGEGFIQIDFSATPYVQKGSGKSFKRQYFPHVICDFDLRAAMSAGLVKSLVLDKRKELGAISNAALSFKCDRDEMGNPSLSEGQRIMLRAGLKKLQRLQEDFEQIDSDKHPKMLIVCEETEVTPLVRDFLLQEGLVDEEILRIDSRQKQFLGSDEWSQVKERLFDLDQQKNCRVVISVLMLREGFDVNNICVIVPLRASESGILLEQTIGRGLRLMWRGAEYEDSKRENRALIRSGKEPTSLIDVLTIIEHPAFLRFYDDLRNEGFEIGASSEDSTSSSTGDLVVSGLRTDYLDYDFSIPFIVREKEEELSEFSMDVDALETFTAVSFGQLKGWVGKGDTFTSEDLQSGTQFGDYRVDGGVMRSTGYNDYLQRMARRIAEALNAPITRSAKTYANYAKYPHFQVNTNRLVEAIDIYIRTKLFDDLIDPMQDENWRVLLLEPVIRHVGDVFARQLRRLEDDRVVLAAEVQQRRLSEVPKINMRLAHSLPVNRCIYERLRYPSRNGGFEKRFIEVADKDSQVERFCKIDEHKHAFLRLRYNNSSGSVAFYHPDFLVKIGDEIFLVEPKATGQGAHADVQRKARAALAWCDQINELPAEERMNSTWSYVLVEQQQFITWLTSGSSLKDILTAAKIVNRSREQLAFTF